MIKNLIKKVGFKKQKIAVRYQSRNNNTKLIAEAMAAALKTDAKPITNKINSCDILYLGGGTYYGKPDKKLVSFINKLDKKKIKEVVLFASSSLNSTGLKKMGELCQRKGLKVNNEKLLVRMGLKGEALLGLKIGKLSKRQLNKIANFIKKIK